MTAMSQRCSGWKWPNRPLPMLLFPSPQNGTCVRARRKKARRRSRQSRRWKRKVTHPMQRGLSREAKSQVRLAPPREARNHDIGVPPNVEVHGAMNRKNRTALADRLVKAAEAALAVQGYVS